VSWKPASASRGKLLETELTFGDVRFAIPGADVKSAS
jgi:hypothetical protein